MVSALPTHDLRRARRAIFAAVAALAASVLPATLVGALGVQVSADLGFTAADLGILLAIFYVLAALASLSAGELSDRIGPRRSLQLAMAASGGSLLLVAGTARSFASLAVLLAFGSIGLTLAGPATKVLVAREVPPSRHGMAFGLQMSAIPFAAVLSGLAVPAVALTIGWRWAFVLATVVPVLGYVVLPKGEESSTVRKVANGGRFSHVAMRPLLVLGLASMLGSAAATTMATFFVIAGTNVGYSEGVAGVLLSVVSALVILLRIVFGGVADRYESGHLQAVVGLFLIAGCGFLIVATGTKALFPLGAFIALSFGWSWTGLMVHAVVRLYPQAPGIASGMIVAGLNSGSVVGPLFFGFAYELGSFGMAFALTGGWTLLAAASTIVGLRKVRRFEADDRAGA